MMKFIDTQINKTSEAQAKLTQTPQEVIQNDSKALMAFTLQTGVLQGKIELLRELNAAVEEASLSEKLDALAADATSQIPK